MAEERLVFSIIGNVTSAIRGLTNFDRKMGQTANKARTDSAIIRNSLQSINNTRVRMAFLDGLDRGFSNTARNVARSSQSIVASSARIRTGVISITAGALGLTALTAGVAALTAAFVSSSDAASTVTARLSTVFTNSRALAQAQADVRSIARASRADLVGVATLYATMSRNARQLGATQAQVAQATRIFSMSLKISGADAAAASSAIRQLSQAIGAGKLSGDEFVSISEANPVFLDMLAVSMGRARGELKALGSQGKITGQEIRKALTDPRTVAYVEQTFGRIPVTFADVRTSISNFMIDATAAFARGFGLNDSLAVMMAKVNQFAQSSIQTFERIGRIFQETWQRIAPVITAIFGILRTAIGFVINNLSALVSVAIVASQAFLMFRFATFITGAAASVRELIALHRALGATGTVSALFSASMVGAQRAMDRFTAACMRNPFVALATALVVVIGLLYQFRNSINIGGGSVASLGDLGAETVSRLGPAFTRLGEIARSVFSSIGQWFEENFSFVADIARRVFGDLDFSLLGFLRLVARVMDFVILTFANGFTAISVVWQQLPALLGSAVTGAADLCISAVERMVNSAITGLNALISLANNVPGIAIGTVGNVSLGRFSGPTTNINAEIARRTRGRRGPVSGVLEDVVRGADARARRRRRAGAGSGSPTGAATLTPPQGNPAANDNGGGRAGADAAKKYEDAIKDLRERIAELNLTEEERQLLDEMERAGLERNINLTGEHADRIRDLVRQLQEGTRTKQFTDALRDFNRELSDLTLTEEQLAVVEARRRAHVPEDAAGLARLTTAQRAQVAAIDETARSLYRLRKAREQLQDVRDLRQNQQQRGEDLALDRQGIRNPEGAEFRRRMLQIDRDLAAERARIEQLALVTQAERNRLLAAANTEQERARILAGTITAEEREQLLLTAQRNAEQAKANVEAERQQELVNSISNFLVDMWDNPREAMKKFFADFMRRILIAIIQAAILGDKMGGGFGGSGGGGGGIGGIIGSALIGALTGRATGGSVSSRRPYLIGEHGPEVFFPGRAGQVMNNRTLAGQSGRGGVTLNSTYNIQLSGNAKQDQMTVARIKQQQAQQNAQIRQQHKVAGWN